MTNSPHRHHTAEPTEPKPLEELVIACAQLLMPATGADSREAIGGVLEQIRTFFAGDTVFLRRHDHKRRTSVLMGESPGRDIASRIDPLQSVSFDTDPIFLTHATLREPLITHSGQSLEYRTRLEAAFGRTDCTVACVPLLIGDATSGVLGLVNFGHRGWDEREVRAVSAIATLIAQFWARVDAQAALEYDATHDRLTGLANRHALVERLDAIDLDDDLGNTALILIAVDELAAIQQGISEDASNQLLMGMADRLETVTRQADIVARVQGDHFAVLMTNASPEDADATAKRIRTELCAPFQTSRGRLTRTVTIGVANSSLLGPGDLLRQARAAVAAGTAEGKDRVVIANIALQDEALRRVETEMALRSAIAANDGQIIPFYQPEFDIVSGQFVGAEALMRWNRPGYGIVPAGDFIDVAESSGLVVDLGALLMEPICLQAAEWAKRFPERATVMRVNVSPAQLVGEGLIELVKHSLAAADLEPSALCLEVTEHVITADMGAARATLDELHELGVHLALDDFGTGYSSMLQLKTMPFDYLKIDRSFVNGLLDDAKNEAVVATVVSLAHALGIEIVAEGVEEPEQLVVLTRLGCRRAQGFLLARPATAAEVTELLNQDWTVDSALTNAGWI